MKSIFKNPFRKYRNPFNGWDAVDLIFLGYVVAVVLLLIGYFLNIIKVIAFMPASFSDIDPVYALRVISIFAAPVGGVIGWF